MSLPEKFCVAPFKSAVVDRDGTMLPCCEYMPDSDKSKLTKLKNIDRWWKIELEDIRKDMINGKVNPGCHHCLSKELNPSYQSHRRHINSKYPNLDFSVELDTIEIRVSNYCNLKCIMCGPYASSSIADEYKKHEDKYNSIGMVGAWEPTVRWWDDQESLDNLKSILTTVSRINFAGGEPLLVPEVTDILNTLDPSKIKNISMNTNLTRLTISHLEAFKRFNSIDIMVSLEGIKEHNDYIRYGSSWASVEQNIKTLKELSNIKLSITHVLQHTSIFSLPNLLNFAKIHNISLRLSEIHYQSYPSPGVLTINSVKNEDIAKFKNWLDSYYGSHKTLLLHWVDSYSFNQDLHDKFCKYIAMLDGIRGNNFANTFQINT
jgi:radical SAM protein with 4Fe4S-binding SPASM domain